MEPYGTLSLRTKNYLSRVVETLLTFQNPKELAVAMVKEFI